MAFNTLMHDRNIYKNRPDFKEISKDFPEFQKFVKTDEKGRVRVDFTDPASLRALTKVLLKKDFNLDVSIPEGFLIPTVPQRLNYILWIEDMLSVLPEVNSPVSGIDIGTGPCAIFSLLGAKKNDWKFIATETSDEAINYANNNIKANNLDSHITVLKTSEKSLLAEVLSQSDRKFDFCLCNPPFFEDVSEIKKKRLWLKESLATTAKEAEILSAGGETAFVKKMLQESLENKNKISIFSSMFGRKKSFLQILKAIKNIEGITYTKTEFCQGNTIRWGIAWTFLPGVNFDKIIMIKPPKTKKEKPPLTYIIPKKETVAKYNVKDILESITTVLSDLEIRMCQNKCHENYAEIQLGSATNTWSHQRRKRRKFNRETTADTNMLSPKTEKIAAESDVSSSQFTAGSEIKQEKASESHETCGTNVADSEPNIDQSYSEKNIDSDSSKKRKQDDESTFMESINAKRQKCNENETKSQEQISTKDKTTSPQSIERSEEIEDEQFKVDVKGDIRTDVTDDTSLDPAALLYCVLKIRKFHTHISFEMNCPPESNRDSMYQIFQLLKNKLS